MGRWVIFFLSVHIFLTFSTKDVLIFTYIWLGVCPLFSNKEINSFCRRTWETVWLLILEPAQVLTEAPPCRSASSCARGTHAGQKGSCPPAQVSPLQSGPVACILPTAFQTVWGNSGVDRRGQEDDLSDLNPQSQGQSQVLRSLRLEPLQGVCLIFLSCQGIALWALKDPQPLLSSLKPAPPGAWPFTPHFIFQGHSMRRLQHRWINWSSTGQLGWPQVVPCKPWELGNRIPMGPSSSQAFPPVNIQGKHIGLNHWSDNIWPFLNYKNVMLIIWVNLIAKQT